VCLAAANIERLCCAVIQPEHKDCGKRYVTARCKRDFDAPWEALEKISDFSFGVRRGDAVPPVRFTEKLDEWSVKLAPTVRNNDAASPSRPNAPGLFFAKQCLIAIDGGGLKRYDKCKLALNELKSARKKGEGRRVGRAALVGCGAEYKLETFPATLQRICLERLDDRNCLGE
jgi:hypothetical protein